MSDKTENHATIAAWVQGCEDEKVSTRIKVIPKSFVVHFRRPQSYDGSYGFDWLQPEFENYASSFDLKKEYKPIKIFGKEYLTPWLSIAKGQTVKVNLVIAELGSTTTFSDNDIIKLPPQKGIRFNPEEIKAKDITKNVEHLPTGKEKGMEIEITCDDDIPFDTVVNVYNQDDIIIGRISLLRNDKELVMPIRVVVLAREGLAIQDENSLLTTMINSADFLGCFDISECMDRLEEYMNKYAYNQAFVRCKMERGSDNIIKTHTVTINETEWINKNYIDANGRIVNRKDYSANDVLILDLLEIYKQQIEKKAGNRFFKGIVMFITNFECVGSKGIGNVNIIDDRNCIIFKNKRTQNKEVYIHEIGHVLSLAHPFEVWNVQAIQQNEKWRQWVDQELVRLNSDPLAKENFWKNNKEDYAKTSRKSYLYYRNKYTFIGNGTKEIPQEGATECMYMDYVDDVNRRVFTQWQWKTIQESVKRFFSR